MSTLVSTGQITIIDQNDARSITAVLIANQSTQQIFAKDTDDIGTFTPSWMSNPLIITPQISIGGYSTAAEVWGKLINKKFVLAPGDAYPGITSSTTSTSFINNSEVVINQPFTVVHNASAASTFTITGNLAASAANFTLFFEADFTDPVTQLTTHIICQISLHTVKTGTNAVFLVLRGKNSIEESTGQTKNNIAIAADLVRASTVDTTGLTYRWYEQGGGAQISTSLSGYATKYGINNDYTSTAPAVGTLGVGIPTNGTWASGNNLTINETAVADIGVYKVEVQDAIGKIYQTFFTIYDISDPYDTQIISSSGDKLQNGMGSTQLTPKVYYGSLEVTGSLTGWQFTWYYYDKDGNRGAFIDTTKTIGSGTVATISAHTSGASASFTYSGSTYSFSPGDIIKCVKPSAAALFYEVASSTVNQVTIRTPASNTWLSFSTYPAPVNSSDFVNGKLYICTTGGTRTTSGAASVTLTGDDVDGKTRVLVEANRP